ncbi:MAG TPA: cbb3-type cytochrome c oxidase subunit II [Candidatus Binatia bacterium]|nr:cbb3-type cytochrome c oxidase subunit II [Candidatus Binatia bacterium]
MKSIGSVAIGAGFLLVTLAMFVQGVLPMLAPESRTRTVTRAVRTDLGDVKWVRYESSDYTPLEARGRAVYIREGCWYCHSQYVRPVAGEEMRWGPLSEAGEYAWDQPHLLSTRRIGPDLSRVGLKLSDDWHYAHHWDPRAVVPESMMPRFRWLFDEVVVAARADRIAPAATDAVRRWFTLRPDRIVPVFVNEDGLAFVRPRPDGGFPVDGTPLLDLNLRRHLAAAPETAPASMRLTPVPLVRLVAPTPDLVALVRYLQKLGTSRGVWRDVFEPQAVGVTAMTIPDSADLRALGREVFVDHCAGCHGARGDGAGRAATFLSPLPRDFTAGVFKFRSTPSGSLPTDGDLYRTITRGVRWTAMPTWHEISDKQRIAVVAYLKTLSRRWKEDALEPAMALPAPPKATPELLARGKALYAQAKCAECHGEGGRGDGPSADSLQDDLQRPIRPADLTRGQLKAGGSVTDVYRTMTTGLDGTPMPSFADSMSDDERWAIAYYVLSFSAWADPLTGERLRLSPETRAALNAPDTIADGPRTAWDPARRGVGVADAPRRRPYYPGVRD